MAQNPNRNAKASRFLNPNTALKCQRPGNKQNQDPQKACDEPTHKNNVYPLNQPCLFPRASGNTMTSSRVSSRSGSIQSLSVAGIGRSGSARTQIRTTAFGRPARMGAPQIRHCMCPARKSSSRQLQTPNNIPTQRRAVHISSEERDNTCPETRVDQTYPTNEAQLSSRYQPSRMPDQQIPCRPQTYSVSQVGPPEGRCVPRGNQRSPMQVSGTRMVPPNQIMQSPALMQTGAPQRISRTQMPCDVCYDSRQSPQCPDQTGRHPTVQTGAPQQISRTQTPYDICYDSRQSPQSPSFDPACRNNMQASAPQHVPGSPRQFNGPPCPCPCPPRAFTGPAVGRTPEPPAVPRQCQPNPTEATPPTPQASATAPATKSPPSNGKGDVSPDQCQGDAEKADPSTNNENEPKPCPLQSKECERRAAICLKKEGNFFRRLVNKVYCFVNRFFCFDKSPEQPPNYYELMKTGQSTCPRMKQLHGLQNLIGTSDARLAYISESIAECAAAKKCGLVQTDKFDICGAESSTRQGQITALATDTYCPGIIQEAVDGTENFNMIAFNLANIDPQQKPSEKPEEEPVTLLEAFDIRVNMEREALKLKVSADTPKQELIEAVQRFFNEKHNPTDLNRSISSFLLTELLEDQVIVEESKQTDHPLQADVVKHYTIKPDHMGVQHVIYIGSTKYDASASPDDTKCEETDEECATGGADGADSAGGAGGAVDVLSHFTRRLANTLIRNQKKIRKV